MKHIYNIFIIACLNLFILLPAVHAQTKHDADVAYGKEQYQKASEIYTQLLQKEGKSSVLYFNLGDCYYRMNDMTKAVLNYQRAKQLDPGNKKIRHNLKLAQSKVADQIVPQSEMFFVTWIKAWNSTKTADAWGTCAIVTFILILAGTAVYLFSSRVLLRKVGFFGALFFVFLTIVFNIFAYQQKKLVTDEPLAVVTVPLIDVKSAPAGAAARQFELHEGITVTIIDNSMKDWKEIKLEDGRNGWVRTSQLELI